MARSSGRSIRARIAARMRGPLCATRGWLCRAAESGLLRREFRSGKMMLTE